MLHFAPATQEQINADICRMALQAARKDPVNCCLAALTLTAKDHASFEAGYKLICEITESNNSLLSACQIFTLAHFMDHRGCPQQAFRLAVNGVRALVVPSHQVRKEKAEDSCIPYYQHPHHYRLIFIPRTHIRPSKTSSGAVTWRIRSAKRRCRR